MVNFSVRTMSLGDLSDSIAWLDNMIEQGDNRRHPRKKVGLRGQYFTQDLRGALVPDIQFRGQIAGVVDMSKGGAGVVSARPMSKGERFTLVCDSQNGKIKLSLQVVRNGKLKSLFHYGCRLENYEKIELAV